MVQKKKVTTDGDVEIDRGEIAVDYVHFRRHLNHRGKTISFVFLNGYSGVVVNRPQQ